MDKDIKSIIIKYDDNTSVEVVNKDTVNTIVNIIKLTIKYGILKK